MQLGQIVEGLVTMPGHLLDVNVSQSLFLGEFGQQNQ